MSHARAAVLLAAAIISPTLAACASDSGEATPPAQESTPQSASSSAATTSPASNSGDGPATVSEYASLVAQHAIGLKDDIRDGLDPEQCSWGLGPPDRDSTGHCRDSAETVQRGARDLADELTSAQDDEALGAPPKQIAKLVKDTIKVARSTDKRAEPALRCAQDYIPGCNSKAVRWSEAMRDMRDMLTAWGPYL